MTERFDGFHKAARIIHRTLGRYDVLLVRCKDDPCTCRGTTLTEDIWQMYLAGLARAGTEGDHTPA